MKNDNFNNVLKTLFNIDKEKLFNNHSDLIELVNDSLSFMLSKVDC